VNNIDEVNKVLQGIVRGTKIVFVGTIISMLFGFLSVAVIARFFSKAEYGVFHLGFDDFKCCTYSCNNRFSEFSAKRGCILQRERTFKDRISYFNGFSNRIIDEFNSYSVLSFWICLCCSDVQRRESDLRFKGYNSLSLPFLALVIFPVYL